jgi:hypothetical protein
MGRWVNRDPLKESAFFGAYTVGLDNREKRAYRKESHLPAALLFLSNDPVGSIDRDGCIGWPGIGIGIGVGTGIGVGVNMYCCRDRIRDALWEEEEWAEEEMGIPPRGTPGSTTDALLHCSASCRMCANPGSCLWASRALRILQRRESAGGRDDLIDRGNNQAGSQSSHGMVEHWKIGMWGRKDL